MTRICNVIIIIIIIFFDNAIPVCINGTPYGCDDGRICFLNQCFQSSGSCNEGNCSSGYICVNFTCLNIDIPATSSTIFTSATDYTTITTTITTTTTTTTTTTAVPIHTTTSECVDLQIPGRASDCSQARYLCNNTIYYTLMTEQCPFTCNRCSACYDQVVNCASVAYLCRNFLYQRLMKEQCRRTCGYCK